MAGLDPGLGLFSTLPQELRNMIFANYFERAEVTWESGDYQHYKIVTYRKCYARELLMVSKEMNAQASAFEEHDLCIAITRRDALLPLSLAQKARHIRFAEAAVPHIAWPRHDSNIFPRLQSITYAPVNSSRRLMQSYRWLQRLMAKGSTESVSREMHNHSLDNLRYPPPEFREKSWDNLRNRPRTRMVIPCQIWKETIWDDEEIHVSIHLHLVAHPLRVEFVEYNGYCFPIPDVAKEQVSGSSLPSLAMPGQADSQQGADAHEEMEGCMTARSNARRVVDGKCVVKAHECVHAVEELFSQQLRRFVPSDASYFTATDTLGILDVKRYRPHRLHIVVIHEARNTSEFLIGAFRRFRRAAARYVAGKLSRKLPGAK